MGVCSSRSRSPAAETCLVGEQPPASQLLLGWCWSPRSRAASSPRICALSPHSSDSLLRSSCGCGETDAGGFATAQLLNDEPSIMYERKSHHGRGKQNSDSRRATVKLENLPADVLYTILSKLPQKEASRTSVLSSNWRHIRDICHPKLSFSDDTLMYHRPCERKQYSQKFVNYVDTILQKYDGKIVEELEVKLEFDTKLVDQLNRWVVFAVLSRTRNLAFVLHPLHGKRSDVRYKFPFHLLDSESISYLQCIQLSFVSLTLPSEFGGFPKLRKLDLHLVHVIREDIEVLLHSCHNLEWLRLLRCPIKGKLQVDSPLSCLLHLAVEQCETTGIELTVMKLVTFKYHGDLVPIVLNHATRLDSANIWFFEATFQDAVSALLNGLPNIQNLTLQILIQRIETRLLLGNPRKFSRLRHLQLLMNINLEEANNIPYIVSFIRAAPFIEKLEVHFGGSERIWFADQGSGTPHLDHCEYNHLKNMHVTGYKGARGQLAFLLHVVEHAPALQALSVDTTQLLYEVDDYANQIARTFLQRAALVARCCLSEKLSPKVKLCVM